MKRYFAKHNTGFKSGTECFLEENINASMGFYRGVAEKTMASPQFWFNEKCLHEEFIVIMDDELDGYYWCFAYIHQDGKTKNIKLSGNTLEELFHQRNLLIKSSKGHTKVIDFGVIRKSIENVCSDITETVYLD